MQLSYTLSESYYVLELGDLGVTDARVVSFTTGKGSGKDALARAEEFALAHPNKFYDIVRARTRISHHPNPKFEVKEFD